VIANWKQIFYAKLQFRNFGRKHSLCVCVCVCGSHSCTVFLLQVSHHPPISACHADSKNFIFWQGNTTVIMQADCVSTNELMSVDVKLIMLYLTDFRREVEK